MLITVVFKCLGHLRPSFLGQSKGVDWANDGQWLPPKPRMNSSLHLARLRGLSHARTRSSALGRCSCQSLHHTTFLPRMTYLVRFAAWRTKVPGGSRPIPKASDQPNEYLDQLQVPCKRGLETPTKQAPGVSKGCPLEEEHPL